MASDKVTLKVGVDDASIKQLTSTLKEAKNNFRDMHVASIKGITDISLMAQQVKEFGRSLSSGTKNSVKALEKTQKDLENFNNGKE